MCTYVYVYAYIYIHVYKYIKEPGSGEWRDANDSTVRALDPELTYTYIRVYITCNFSSSSSSSTTTAAATPTTNNKHNNENNMFV